MERLIIMGQLREYMKSVPYLTILEEINPVNDGEELNILLGVGLRGVLYYAVIAKKLETGNIR